ncbi:MAG: hypothetical protein M3O71_19100 [Bacteroidota bacterium]|nr:hypothetical protein [Bacteroidota bacterium]
MIKLVVAFAFCIILIDTAHAQRGGLIYYLKDSGKLVQSKDSADYSMVVLPPDISVDKNLFVVYEYGKNGKVRLVTNSKTNDVHLKYDGHFISYYANGKKKATGTFENGKAIGKEVGYYPNGNLFYVENRKADGKIFYQECRDSTGKTLAVNGSGNWIQFDDEFKNAVAEGKVDSGREDGVWHLVNNGTTKVENNYKKGELIYS